jgi:hypothetical protein
MSDDYTIQYSVKTPRDSMLNLRANTPEEFEKVAAWALQNSARFIDLETAIKGVPAALAGNVTQVQVQPAPTYQQNAYQAPANEPTGPGPSCVHGPMNFRSGTSKKTGKPYSGWFCSDNVCQAQFNH